MPIAGSRGCTPGSRDGAYGVEHRYRTVAWSLSATNACPSPSPIYSACLLSSSSRTACQRPKVGETTLRSTATSMIAPLAHVTYFAWPGGTSEKWMPRTTPRRDTEQLAWARSMLCPTSALNSASRNHSRKLPRRSPWICGVNSQAPSTSRAFMGSRYRPAAAARGQSARGERESRARLALSRGRETEGGVDIKVSMRLLSTHAHNRRHLPFRSPRHCSAAASSGGAGHRRRRARAHEGHADPYRARGSDQDRDRRHDRLGGHPPALADRPARRGRLGSARNAQRRHRPLAAHGDPSPRPVTSVPGQALHDQSLHNQNVHSQSPLSQRPHGQSPAARRPRRPAAERRRQILAAARTLFAERGFDATTTRDLAAAADINDALIYRYFPDKHAILAALVDEAIAVFQGLPKPPDQAAVPLESLLELLGTGFVNTIQDNLDLVTILISERQALAGDTRFVEFVDDAATRLGRLIDATTGGQADGQGYLTARAYFGALIAFVLLQDQLGLASIRQVDAAEYVRHLAQVTVRGIT